jgi:putative component of membrane protein insertase Oxa1/YidC/SpoIIIJ protein YidD
MTSRIAETPPWRLQVSAFFILALILGNLAPIAGAGISIYRKSIAPALGIHCAFAHATRGESCSAFAERILSERGFFKGLPDCVHRFQACSLLAGSHPAAPHPGTHP